MLYDDTIPANAKLLYGQITQSTDTDGRCTLTNEQLAGPNGLSERSVSRLVKSLEEAGHIELRYTPDARDGHPTRSIYQVLQAPPLTAKNGNKVIDKNVYPLLPKKSGSNVLDNIYINPPQAPQGGQACQPAKRASKRAAKSTPDWKPERFEGFWKFYPRGEGRQAAVRAWDRLRPDDQTVDRIAAALVTQKQTDEWRRGIGIPHASTYLNQRRWEDEQRDTTQREAAPAENDGTVDLSGLRLV